MRRAICFLMILSLLQSQALAWSAGGHKIVASIAFRQLTAEEQAKVVALLKEHPRFAQDFKAKMPEEIASGSEPEKNEWIFQQAAIWPDLARGFPEGLQKKFHRAQWHYINVPHFLTGTDRVALDGKLKLNLSLEAPESAVEGMNVVQTIRYARTILKSDDAEKQQKALMLSWLMHTEGDLHQPLHSTALFSRFLFPNGDRGGNRVVTSQRGSLHSVWDSFPGGKIQFQTARNRAIQLMNDEELSALGAEAAKNLDEKTWLDESHLLAVTVAYDPEVIGRLRILEMSGDEGEFEPIKLSETYLKTGSAIADRRVVQAGYRLGAILKETVAE
ncbi:MAG: S1/P1 nuclease [Planctomycetes bacterium]|nr:S1/P1 nuclease [Planctomycetota bacterium]MBI3461454.1 S1/P1 nuclease [Planctomycetota bacterium]